jgi:hypothetical protein
VPPPFSPRRRGRRRGQQDQWRPPSLEEHFQQQGLHAPASGSLTKKKIKQSQIMGHSSAHIFL